MKERYRGHFDREANKWVRGPTIEDMVGQTFVTVNNHGDEMEFLREDGTGFVFYHNQDCCEQVYIEDVTGNLLDLEGSPLLMAESVDGEPPNDSRECPNWTFYKFRTMKGDVTVRWFGDSNGYYSTSVDFASLR